MSSPLKAVAEPCRPSTIQQYYVFNDQDSSRTGHHWFTVCLRVTRRVGENENASPEAERSPKRSPERSPQRSPQRSPKKWVTKWA